MTRTRFAPSPTGHLHIGGARTALFCWAWARRSGGTFILRIEDTDQARSSEAATAGILEDLAWLGIDWDEGPDHCCEGRSLGGDRRDVGPFFQAQRIDLYNQHIDRLIDAGAAYPAFEKPEELEAARREAIEAKRQYKYDRAALEIPEADRRERMRNEPHVIRFRVPDEPVRVDDVVLGEVAFQPAELEDFIIRKRDGFPTYHLAVVVDDALMGVTHVLRGQEHLMNTPKHLLLQQALGVSTPVYAHMPLIFNMGGGKMSKRDRDKAARKACREAGLKTSPVEALDDEAFAVWLGDKSRQLDTDILELVGTALSIELPEISVDDFRRAGYLPEAICNFLALLGWSPGGDIEKFDMTWLAGNFDLDRIGRTNAKFDRDKLLSFNADAMGALDDEVWVDRWLAWCRTEAPEIERVFSRDQLLLLTPALKPRARTWQQAVDQVAFALREEFPFDEKAVAKALHKGERRGIDVLAELRDEIIAVEPFTPEAINAVLAGFADDQGLGMGKVAQPLRVALTGSGVSPPIDVTLAVLGPARVAARIERCLQEFG